MVRQLTPSGVGALRSFLVDGTSRLTTPADPTDEGPIVRDDGGRLMHVRDFDGCETRGPSPDQSTWVGCPGLAAPDWLPASAWEDPVFRPFVPHSYQVCLYADPRSAPADVLPADAVDPLLSPESPVADSPVEQEVLCRVLARSHARELRDVIEQAGPGYGCREGDLELGCDIPSRWTTAEGLTEGWLSFLPVLPHGGTYGPGG